MKTCNSCGQQIKENDLAFECDLCEEVFCEYCVNENELSDNEEFQCPQCNSTIYNIYNKELLKA